MLHHHHGHAEFPSGPDGTPSERLFVSQPSPSPIMRRYTTSPRPFVFKRNAKRICQAAIASAVILTGPIHAQNVNWIGDFNPGEDLWTNGANWDIGFTPGTTDIAVFSLNEASTINLGGTSQEIGGLSFTQP